MESDDDFGTQVWTACVITDGGVSLFDSTELTIDDPTVAPEPGSLFFLSTAGLILGAAVLRRPREERVIDFATAQERGSGQPKPRLLAISAPGEFSGLPDTVLRYLRGYAEIVSVIDGLRVPRPERFWIAAQTFGLSRDNWGRRYYARLGSYYKRPSSLSYRIRYCEGRLRGLRAHYDLIYQFGALFGALNRPTDAPLILHIDFTTRLAERYYPGWLPESKVAIEEWNGIEAKIYHSADLIAVPTKIVAASLVDHYSVQSDKIAVVGMGAHIDDLAEDFPKPQSRILVFAGPHFERHGGVVALEILEEVRRHVSDATLVTVTNRSVDAPGVKNLGIVSRERLHEILKQAAVLLMPGPVGGYQTVTEAMAAKCLCIVAEDNPHMFGLIRSGENGISLSPGHSSEAAKELTEYLRAPDRLRTVGERARRKVIDDCKWSAVVSRVWHEIGRLLSIS